MKPADTLTENIPFKLHFCSRQYGIQLGQLVKPLGLTRSQIVFLATLFHYPGINQKQLAGVMDINRSAVGGMVKRLAEKGWVTRTQDQSNSRVFNIQLSAKTKPLLSKLFILSERLIEESLSELSENEVASLYRSLNKISDYFNQPPAEQPSDIQALHNEILAIGKGDL